MTWPHRLAIAAVAVTSVIAAATFKLGSNGSTAGRLAARYPLGDPVVAGRVAASRLGRGPIVQLVVSDDRIVILQNHSWSVASMRGGDGPYGAATRGEGGYIASAAEAFLADSLLYILDQSARGIHTFAISGGWRRTVSLRALLPQFVPARFAVRNDIFVVAGYENSPALPRWLVLAIRERHVDTLLVRSGSPFEIVIPLFKQDSVFAVISSTYQLLPVLPAGRAVIRRNPPMVALPRSEQATLNTFLLRLPPDVRRSLQLPRTIPIVMSAMFTDHGSLLAAITHSADDFVAEEIDARGQPLRTLGKTLTIPFALSSHALYTTRETMDETVVVSRAFPRSVHVD